MLSTILTAALLEDKLKISLSIERIKKRFRQKLAELYKINTFT
jgi:hypothetical protein